uniref:Mth938 domain-containing protein n=1 Tax=Alexandrium monilatum TaxID=311494 RepID=A0A7S4SZY2_9DINO
MAQGRCGPRGTGQRTAGPAASRLGGFASDRPGQMSRRAARLMACAACLAAPAGAVLSEASVDDRAAQTHTRRDAFHCQASTNCPEVSSISWGKIVVRDPATGNTQQFRDIKIWPGGAKPWDWRETGTRHSPGTQLADVHELLQSNPEVVIVSRGMSQRLHVSPELQEVMRAAEGDSGVRWLELPSDKVAETYSELLSSGRRVAAIVHSTC